MVDDKDLFGEPLVDGHLHAGSSHFWSAERVSDLPIFEINSYYRYM